MGVNRRTSGLLVAARPRLSAPAYAEFADDFESGGLAAWPTKPGPPAVHGNYKDTGSYGVRLNPANSQSQIASGTAKWSQSGLPYFSLKQRMQFRSLETGGGSTNIATIQNTTQLDNVDCRLEGAELVLDVANDDELHTGVEPALNVWHTIRIRGYFGSGGVWWAEVNLDGADLGRCESDDSGPGGRQASAASTRSLHIGTNATSLTFETWLDNVVMRVAATDLGWIP